MFDLSWYRTLNQPAFTPPDWIFAPVWALIYIIIFIAFVIYAVKKTSNDKKWGYFLFFLQMILNLCWSPIFFCFHNIGLALTLVVLMDIIVFLMIIEFIRISKTAGLLLIPYLIWLIYATYLNAGFLTLN